MDPKSKGEVTVPQGNLVSRLERMAPIAGQWGPLMTEAHREIVRLQGVIQMVAQRLIPRPTEKPTTAKKKPVRKQKAIKKKPTKKKSVRKKSK